MALRALSQGAVFNRTEKDFRPAVNLGRSQQVLTEKVSTDCGTHGGGVRDEDGTLTHVDNGTSVGEGAGEERLLSGGEADRVIEIVTNFTHSSISARPRALEGVNSNAVFAAKSDKSGSHQSSASLRVAVGDVEGTKMRIRR
jgi:hypothetical protein